MILRAGEGGEEGGRHRQQPQGDSQPARRGVEAGRDALDSARGHGSPGRPRAGGSKGRRRSTTKTTTEFDLSQGQRGRACGLMGRRRRGCAGRHVLACGRAKTSPAPSTCCSSTKRARCRSPTCWPSRRPPTAWCCSATRSNSISREKASHPDGVGISALEHVLGGHETMPAGSRHLPAHHLAHVADADRVHVGALLRRQARREGRPRTAGAARRGRPSPARTVDGCRSSTTAARARRTRKWRPSPRSWSACWRPGRCGSTKPATASPLTAADIRVVAPFNAQVNRIAERLGARPRQP